MTPAAPAGNTAQPPGALMLFAAGLGTRMGALTADRPKPLVPLAGRPLIDHALDHAFGYASGHAFDHARGQAAGIPRIVVNTHYRAEQLAAHLAARHPGRGIAISHEPELLDTGGGLKAALPLLGPGPVFTLNPDVAWRGPNPLALLAAAWRPHMAGLLLLVPSGRARARLGGGDATLAPDGRLVWGGDLVYTGAQILRTEALASIPDRAFPLHRLWARAAPALHGLIYPGDWCDAGHPDGLAQAEAMLAERP
ncbi:MAG: nucleotidyltransferase family protein [Alkalilacustris sp.]